MNLLIPFESKVKFDKKVSEIASISLECEKTFNDEGILGSFIVSGTYKEHELSVNTQDFKFTLPFEVSFTTSVDLDTLIFNIDNFKYSLNDSELTINIDYIVEASEKEIIRNEEPKEEINIVKEDRAISFETTNMDLKDDYITYLVHFVKEEDTLESILIKYNISKEDFKKMNGASFNIGDKLLIPDING